MVMVPCTTAKKERCINIYYAGHGVHLHQQLRRERSRKKEGERKNVEGKMRLIKIKKMHLPLSAQPRRTTIDDMIRWELSGEVKERKKSIICVTNA